MPVFIRDATPEDAAELVEILNPIIEDGRTTAHRSTFDTARMIAHYIAPARAISCKLAEDRSTIVGFQALEWADPGWTGPDPVPSDWAVIATFVRQGVQARGIGGALFTASRDAAQRAGPAAIDATIRADNVPGLAYYARMGFVDYDLVRNLPLSDGTRVDRVRKRYDMIPQV